MTLGIGLAVCERLLNEHGDVTVLLGSRDAGRGKLAVEKLQATYGKQRVRLVVLDVTSTGSIAAAAESVDTLFGLVNNAAVGLHDTPEKTINTNYWGVRRVTDAFLPKLQHHGRIVNVSSASGAYYVQAMDRSNPLKEVLGSPWKFKGISEMDEIARRYRPDIPRHLMTMPKSYYGESKALLNAYTYRLARQHPHLIVNCMEPGLIDTDMTKELALGASDSPWKGAEPVLHCLFNIPTTARQGCFYGSDCKRSPWHKPRGPREPEYKLPVGV